MSYSIFIFKNSESSWSKRCWVQPLCFLMVQKEVLAASFRACWVQSWNTQGCGRSQQSSYPWIFLSFNWGCLSYSALNLPEKSWIMLKVIFYALKCCSPESHIAQPSVFKSCLTKLVRGKNLRVTGHLVYFLAPRKPVLYHPKNPHFETRFPLVKGL